jgi:hypothetical protein
MSAATRRPRTKAAFAFTVVTVLLAFAAPVAGATMGNPGSVKIHEVGGADADDRRNEPKVTCDFTMHFFGGQPMTSGWYRIEAWPRGNDAPAVADSGVYTTDEDGDAQAEPNTRLPSGMYKLFWQTTDGHAKYKVFKVVSCPEEEPPVGEG